MVNLVTGGAGFIGRWVVKKLLSINREVIVIDNLKNGRKENLIEFINNPNLKEFIIGDVKDDELIEELFSIYKFSICIHLAAQINVQESLDHPEKAFENNLVGTYNILEAARKINTKVVLIGTCMVYDLANSNIAISEQYSVKPTSPYAGSKLAAEELALSYYYGFNLPVVILRPFNTYGPFQKTNMDGGVISIFIKQKLNNEKLLIYGDGTQTRDLLYVEDCADFIVKTAECKKCIGEIINAGTGKDISINDLAFLIVGDNNRIKHVKHHHPQSEIMKLVCDNSKVKNILNWEPKTDLKEGIAITEKWIIQVNLRDQKITNKVDLYEKEMGPQEMEKWSGEINLDYHIRQYKETYRSTIFFCDFLEQFNVLNKGNIGDIGAGLGSNIRYMSERFPNTDFVGIDLDPQLVTLGNEYLRKYKAKNCKLIQGDIYNLDPVLIGTFDGILITQLLLALSEYKTPLEKIIDLKPKWIGLNSLFYDGPINATILIKDYNIKFKNKPYKEYYHNIYSIDLVRKLFKKHGYETFEYTPFEIDIDLKNPNIKEMGTYTVKTIEGKRIQISGPLLMNWYFIFTAKNQY
jgi:nucleoside-diphosphate-sugar epimerase/ubiquinone/menaquinone biosynthesis C-methylase UbiE